MKSTSNNTQPDSVEEHAIMAGPSGAEAEAMEESQDSVAMEQRVRPLWTTFRNILIVVLLIFIFAVLQMIILNRVCNSGMKTAMSLKQTGLPTLNELASLQENIAIFRLYSYEYLFAREAEKGLRAKSAEAVAKQVRGELHHIKALLPETDGQRLANILEREFNDLNTEFRRVRDLVDTNFTEAMKATDEEIPPRVASVVAATTKLKEYGYRVSGGQASATFGSFGWIKNNAFMFGAANSLVALGAVIFVKMAARRSRHQISDAMGRLDERTQELAGSLSVVNATLEATADGIVLTDGDGLIRNFNQQFIKMWCVSGMASITMEKQLLGNLMQPQLRNPDKLASKLGELSANPEMESFDVFESGDQRVFECWSKPQRIHERICGRVWSFRDVTGQKQMQVEIEKTHRQLLLASRQAGMAEVATGVLHNVGNVLNSVNISASLLCEGLNKSRISSVAQLGKLLTENSGNLPAFFTTDERGRHLPGFVNRLAECLSEERGVLLKESDLIRANVDHIKDIVSMQQNYAKATGVVESIKVTDLIEDALRMNEGALVRHAVGVVRNYHAPDCEIAVERHKVLQILVNLIRNSKYACDESNRTDKQITLTSLLVADRVQIIVTDNGVGIPAGNLTLIFNHGFTTRKNGHGFGLHSAALAANEMGGMLSACSDGPQQGASFTLELPMTPPANHQ